MLLRPKVVKQSQSFVSKPHRDRSISSMEVKKVKRLNLRTIIGQEATAGTVKVPSDSPDKSFNNSKSFNTSKN